MSETWRQGLVRLTADRENNIKDIKYTVSFSRRKEPSQRLVT